MTRRGIPPDFSARQRQGRRSTFTGTLDGRMANAYPVQLLEPGRHLSGQQGTTGPTARYVATDVGGVGVSADTWPARKGPTLTYADWYAGRPAPVVDSDGSLRCDAVGPHLTWFEDDVNSPDTRPKGYGVANGWTIMGVLALPPMEVLDSSTTAMVDIWYSQGGGYRAGGAWVSDGDLDGWCELTARDDRESGVDRWPSIGSITSVAGGYDSALWGHTGSSLFTGSRQYMEAGAGVGSPAYCRLDGVDLADPTADPTHGPFIIRSPLIGIAGTTGQPARLWEVAMFPKLLQGDQLAYWRTYFATTYGVTT